MNLLVTEVMIELLHKTGPVDIRESGGRSQVSQALRKQILWNRIRILMLSFLSHILTCNSANMPSFQYLASTQASVTNYNVQSGKLVLISGLPSMGTNTDEDLCLRSIHPSMGFAPALNEPLRNNNESNKSFQTPILYTWLSSSLYNSVTIKTWFYAVQLMQCLSVTHTDRHTSSEDLSHKHLYSPLD